MILTGDPGKKEEEKRTYDTLPLSAQSCLNSTSKAFAPHFDLLQISAVLIIKLSFELLTFVSSCTRIA
jgi:hypothetical protein